MRVRIKTTWFGADNLVLTPGEVDLDDALAEELIAEGVATAELLPAKGTPTPPPDDDE